MNEQNIPQENRILRICSGGEYIEIDINKKKGGMTMKAHPKKKQATPGVSHKGMKMPSKAPHKSAGGGTSRTAGPQKPL